MPKSDVESIGPIFTPLCSFDKLVARKIAGSPMYIDALGDSIFNFTKQKGIKVVKSTLKQLIGIMVCKTDDIEFSSYYLEPSYELEYFHGAYPELLNVDLFVNYTSVGITIAVVFDLSFNGREYTRRRNSTGNIFSIHIDCNGELSEGKILKGEKDFKEELDSEESLEIKSQPNRVYTPGTVDPVFYDYKDDTFPPEA